MKNTSDAARDWFLGLVAQVRERQAATTEAVKRFCEVLAQPVPDPLGNGSSPVSQDLESGPEALPSNFGDVTEQLIDRLGVINTQLRALPEAMEGYRPEGRWPILEAALRIREARLHRAISERLRGEVADFVARVQYLSVLTRDFEAS